jgi:DNA-binding XRE family transcriptional regulator
MKEKEILKLLEKRRLEHGISKREFSTRAKLSHATYASLFKPKHEMSLRVASAMLQSVGARLEIVDDTGH